MSVMAIAIIGSAAIAASSASDTNDTQEGIANSQAGLAREELAWKKQMYADSAGERAAASARANEMSNAQVAMMNQQMAMADEYATYQRETFRPLEKDIVADAEAYDTPERREAAANAAKADVESNMATQRGIASRNQTRRGVNVSSGQALATDNQMAISGAAMSAGASNSARTQVETIGHARKMDAASLGRNLASNQAASAGLAISAANGAAQNAQLPIANTAAGVDIMTSGYAGAQRGLAGAASTYSSLAAQQAKQDQDNSAMWSSLGSAAAKYYMASDEKLKEDIKPMNPEQALQAVVDTPVSSWAYKNGTAPDDGGKTHTGPMAQDVKKTMGDKVAPKGKKIDLISMNGIAMAAIQGLSKKMDRVMAAQGLPA